MASSDFPGRSESPVFNSKTFAGFASEEHHEIMTVHGAVGKTAILLGIVVAAAVWAWTSISPAWLGLVLLSGLGIGLLTTFVPRAAPITAPLYALLEGAVLGGISAFFEGLYPGIAFRAVLLTFGVLLGLLAIYWVSDFHVTAPFRTGIIGATFGIVLVYLLDVALWLVGYPDVTFLHQGGWIGIGLSLFVVVIAALNLVLDFDLIEHGAEVGAPKYMEWYAAYGLMVTLIWLYLEVLKLLVQIAASRDDD
jgi:uncharacterized YccA/Bax inhibitor family protein